MRAGSVLLMFELGSRLLEQCACAERRGAGTNRHLHPFTPLYP